MTLPLAKLMLRLPVLNATKGASITVVAASLCTSAAAVEASPYLFLQDSIACASFENTEQASRSGILVTVQNAVAAERERNELLPHQDRWQSCRIISYTIFTSAS